MSKKVKIYYGSEIRRLTITEKITYNDFVQKIHDFYKIQNSKVTKEFLEQVTFKYLDNDEDWVTFSTQEEWLETLENSKKILKIKITSKNEEKKFSFF